MKLQNDYKIIYEKMVEGKRHLYAGKNSVPAEEDVEIKYDALTEDQVKAFKLIYESGEGFKGSDTGLPGESDKAFALTDGKVAILAGDKYQISKKDGDDVVVNPQKASRRAKVEAPAAPVEGVVEQTEIAE